MLQNKTVVNEDTLLAISRGTVKVARAIIGIVCPLFLLFMGVMGFLDEMSLSGDPVFALIPLVLFCVFAVALFVWGCFFYQKTLKKAYRRQLGGKYSTVTFTFEGTELVMDVTSNVGLSEHATLSYVAFERVEEHRDCWIFQYNQMYRYVAMKAGMTEGTAEELSAFLRMRILNYVVKG